MDRPTVAPTCFSFRREGKGEWLAAAMGDIGNYWAAAVQWARWTIVSDEWPKPPYPNGLYFEGWPTAPHRMRPPHQAADFAYPLIGDVPASETEAA